MQVKDHANPSRRATQRTADEQSCLPALALMQLDLIQGLESMEDHPEVSQH